MNSTNEFVVKSHIMILSILYENSAIAFSKKQMHSIIYYERLVLAIGFSGSSLLHQNLQWIDTRMSIHIHCRHYDLRL
jgi:hypothetical protein